MTSALLLLAMIALIFVNGFFVAAEFALVRSSRSKLEDLAKGGSASAGRAVALHEDMNQYLSSCQVGITLASLGIGFLGEPAIARLVEPLFGSLSHGVATVLAFLSAYLIATSAHITVGEQVPKIASIIHPERTTMLVARPLRWFTLLMSPFVSIL
ncbi:MAG TPA: CNNM domain-containing protein, partial [Baekduia sp.]|nr:CNNM domain-containing protein [Baekduia sp.]